MNNINRALVIGNSRSNTPSTFVHEFLSYVNEDNDERLWNVSTRYYSAQLHFDVREDAGLCVYPLQEAHQDGNAKQLDVSEYQALILLVDAHDEECVESAKSWNAYLDEYDARVAVRLCINCSAESNAVLPSLESWCIDNNVEIVSMSESVDPRAADEDSGARSFYFGDEFGFGRVRGALEANAWEFMSRKKVARMMAPMEQREGVTEEEIVLAKKIRDKVRQDGKESGVSLKACANCNLALSDAMRCSACKRVYYCAVECQRLHWKAHKASCKILRKLVSPPPTSTTTSTSQPQDLSMFLTEEQHDDEVEEGTKAFDSALNILAQCRDQQSSALSNEERLKRADQFAAHVMTMLGE